MAVRTAIKGIALIIAKTAVEISWIRRCPAVRLAVSRTPKARGRINRLIVSIIISTGISKGGVLSGRRCANAWVGCVRSPIITVANQAGTANAILNDSCVVGVNVYGKSPSILIVIRKTISEIINSAQV